MNQQVVIQCGGQSSLSLDAMQDFQGNLKDLSKESYEKFKKQLLELGFSEPISIWKNKDKNYILNGHQRVRTLKAMREEGIHIPPELPVNLVEAKDLKEAKKKVLALTSQYGQITDDGLYEFAEMAGITFEELKTDFRLPEIDLDKYEKQFYSEDEPENIVSEHLIFSKESIAESAFSYYRKSGFPYPRLELHEQKQELNQLAQTAGDALKTTRLGYQIADTYNKHRFHAAAIKMASPYDSFQDDKKLNKAIRWHLESSRLSTNFFGALSLVSGTQACSNFRPGFAKLLYDKYAPSNAKVFDSSTGYGGRLVGFLASNCSEYIGTDPNVPTFKANQEMVKSIGQHKKVTLFNSPIEDLDVKKYKNYCDFAFTSPPYFVKETYSKDKTQSCQRYKKYDEWLNGFLKEMLKKQFFVLKSGAINIINIEDVSVSGTDYKLVEPTIELAKSIGFKHIKTERFDLPSRTTLVDGEKQVEQGWESVIILEKS